MHEDVRKILETAVMAPSGENCQPWKFVVKDMSIDVMNVPERDQSLYSWGQRASYMAIGAAIENISLAAIHFGYSADVTLFPEPEKNINHVAQISLVKSEVIEDLLYAHIFERSTNRKAYETKPIEQQNIQALIDSSKEQGVKILFTQDTENKMRLGRAGSVNEEVMMGNKYLHNFFFSHVNWNKEEDDQKKIGFFIDTLELPPPARIGFKLFKHWPLAHFFNNFGLNTMIAKQNAVVNASASGFGCIVILDKNPEQFVRAGRSLERLWLTATSLGLSLQPLTGVLFFMYKILANETDKFSVAEVATIQKAYADIARAFGVTEHETVAFMFRVGYGGKPTARSARFSVDESSEVLHT